ncbi:MAG: hypothetical protein KDD45_04835 [Bdellovibrionales bacterium]|nr:hypothetical protein [Bdellovibrionales bacterium]
MDKKIPKNDSSAADDLFSSLLEDVGDINNLSTDPSEILEDTVYDELPSEEVSEFLMPSFNNELELSADNSDADKNNLSENDAGVGADFWKNFDSESNANNEISFSKIPKELGIENVNHYEGPAADDNFLDQFQFNLANDNKDSEHSNDKAVELDSNDEYSPFTKSEYSDKINDQQLEPLGVQNFDHNEVVEDLNMDLQQPKNDKTEVVLSDPGIPSMVEERTDHRPTSPNTDIEKTIAVTKFAQRQKDHLSSQESATSSEDKLVFMSPKTVKTGLSQVSIDASLVQAESLRIAQNRIIDLEKEIERLRQENDEILTASEVIRNKTEELTLKVSDLEKENGEIKSEYKNENSLLKGNLLYKESENSKLQDKIDELELRVKNDFKKIRIRERELENRLELMKAEKQAIIKSKDDLLLELQRKNDVVKSELDTYRNKVQELNKTIESYQNQIKITVRTLRLALSHVEDKGDNQPIKYKKAT